MGSMKNTAIKMFGYHAPVLGDGLMLAEKKSAGFFHPVFVIDGAPAAITALRDQIAKQIYDEEYGHVEPFDSLPENDDSRIGCYWTADTIMRAIGLIKPKR